MQDEFLKGFEHLYNINTNIFMNFKLPTGMYYLIDKNKNVQKYQITEESSQLNSLYQEISYYYRKSKSFNINKAINKKFLSNTYLAFICKCEYFTSAYYKNEKNNEIQQQLSQAFENYYALSIQALGTRKKDLQENSKKIMPYKNIVSDILKEFSKNHFDEFKKTDIIGIFFKDTATNWQAEELRIILKEAVLSKDTIKKEESIIGMPDFLHTGIKEKLFLWGTTLGFLPDTMTLHQLKMWHLCRQYIELLYQQKKILYIHRCRGRRTVIDKL